jgi:serine/threonine protein kinase
LKIDTHTNKFNKVCDILNLFISRNIPVFPLTELEKVTKNSNVFDRRTPDGKKKTYIYYKVNLNNDNFGNNDYQITLIKQFIYSCEVKSKYLSKPKGYHLENNEIYLTFKYYEYSFNDILNNYELDFVNKIKILNMLLELVKDIHVNGYISLQLSPENLKFSKNYVLKHILGNSVDLKSQYYFDSIFFLKKNYLHIYDPPEIHLKESHNISWHCDIWSLGILISRLFSYEINVDNITLTESFYRLKRVPRALYKYIDNLFVQSITLGLLRLDSIDRPNIFEIIDNYNNMIRLLKSQSDTFNASFYIINSKDEYISNFY